MAKDYKDKLQYRIQNSDGTWPNDAWVVLSDDASSPFTLNPTLDVTKTYEFQVVRSKPGSITKVSAAPTNQQTYFGTVKIADGGSIPGVGTYTIPGASAGDTVTRTTGNPSSILSISANWEHVRISYNNGANTYVVWKSKNDNDNQTPFSLVNGPTYTVDPAKIAKIDVKTVHIMDLSSFDVSVTVVYNGGSTGSFTANAL